MIRLNRTCKEVTSLVVAQQDHPLRLNERLVLKMHLAICENCTRLDQQMLRIRSGFKQWRNYVDESDKSADVRAKK
jgi:hypothetical protein